MVRAHYWCVQVVFCYVTYLFGTVMGAVLVGTVALAVEEASARQKQFVLRCAEVEYGLQNLGVSPALRSTVCCMCAARRMRRTELESSRRGGPTLYWCGQSVGAGTVLVRAHYWCGHATTNSVPTPIVEAVRAEVRRGRVTGWRSLV